MNALFECLVLHKKKPLNIQNDQTNLHWTFRRTRWSANIPRTHDILDLDGCACRNLDDADDQPTTTTFAIVNDFYNQYINDLQPIQQLSPNCSAEVMESIGGILPAPQPTSINDFMVDYHEQVRRVGQLLSNSSNLSKKCLQEVVQAQGQS